MTQYRSFRPSFSSRSCYLLRDEDEERTFASFGGAPEAKLIQWAASLIAPKQTFVDIGAHVGSWTQHLAQSCARVHAFEPQKSTFDRLEEGTRLSEITNITCHNVALGANGEVDLHVVSVDGGGSTIRHRSELPSVMSVERVRAAQLDDYAFDDLGLIKIDVEGNEMEVLRGATRTLEEHRPQILFEAWMHEWYVCDRAELIGYVERLGYRVRPVADCPEMLHATPVAPMVSVAFSDLMHEVEEALPDGGDWCTMDKAGTLVSLIVGLRPRVVVELGVWMGGSAIPMAIALRHLGHGKIVAIDAWAPAASVAGQQGNNATWWGEVVGAAGHDKAYATFMDRIKKHGLQSRCVVQRKSTEEAPVPAVIDFLHHDANHGPQAVLDIERWAPAVRIGGLLVIDDLDWEGGHVQRARDRAEELGFVELYRLGTGCVMQRVR